MKEFILIILGLLAIPAQADYRYNQNEYDYQQEMSDYRRKVQEDNYARERYQQQQEANDIARQQLKQQKLQFQYDVLFGDDKDRY